MVTGRWPYLPERGVMSRRSADLPLFLLVAFGLSWLFVFLLWAGDLPLTSPAFPLIGIAMMFTPALGVLAVRLYGRRRGTDGTTRREWAGRTGLTLGGRRGRTFALIALAWFGIPLLAVVAIALSAALGLLAVDLDGLSLLRRNLERTAPGRELPVPPGVLLALRVAPAFLVAPLVAVVAAVLFRRLRVPAPLPG